MLLRSTAGAYVARHVGMLLVPTLPLLLDAPLVWRPVGPPPRDLRALIGWGLKGKSARTAALAAATGLPYVAVEDGFLRSVGLGDTDAPLSVVVDDVGVYYDATRPSALERHVAAARGDAQAARGLALAAAWRAARVSKYNHAREAPPPVAGPFVLAVDQTFGDMSIALGLATPASFARMLEAALDEHPTLPVVLKVHPDVIAGRKRAHFERLPAGAAARVTLLADDLHAPALLEAAAAVYVVTSQMGFEALLWQRPVRCFGMPFYGGWGLTADDLPAPARRCEAGPATLGGLVHAALVDYPRYLDPETQQRCEAERLVAWMGLQRRARTRFPAALRAVGFAQWQRPLARACFAGSRVDFPEPTAPGDDDGATAVARWAAAPAGDAALAPGTLAVSDGPLAQLLGRAATPARPLPCTWSVTAPDGPLEQRLAEAEVDPAQRGRARALREAVVAHDRAAAAAVPWTPAAPGRRVVLVAADDATDAAACAALVAQARAAEPDAWLALWGRPGTPLPAGCDAHAPDRPLGALLGAVDAVHVDASPAGFAALLHGRRVVCHGRPFYAGWGLTDDRAAPPHARKLDLDALVAVALIDAPVYLSRATGAWTTPEGYLAEQADPRRGSPPPEPALPALLRRLKAWRDRRNRRR